MKIEVKTNIRRTKHVDRLGMPGERSQPVVEVWIDGICCHHECVSMEEARTLVIRLAYALGVE